jgi:hypothetical protein
VQDGDQRHGDRLAEIEQFPGLGGATATTAN